jgi:hypothetical protein
MDTNLLAGLILGTITGASVTIAMTIWGLLDSFQAYLTGHRIMRSKPNV